MFGEMETRQREKACISPNGAHAPFYADNIVVNDPPPCSLARPSESIPRAGAFHSQQRGHDESPEPRHGESPQPRLTADARQRRA